MQYDKTILVTGGMGFIGSNFLNICVPKYKNYLFINIDSFNYAADEKNVTISSEPNYKFFKIDIRDENTLDKVFKENKITDIIHFAAETLVDKSLEDPKLFLETNVFGTFNLLSLARGYKINRFLHISTDEIYGSLDFNDPSFTISSLPKPNTPYSASKLAGDSLVRAFNKTFGLNTVVTRSVNNYGPNQDDSKLIPKFISLLFQDKKVPIHGKGEHIRDWLYVDDHIEALDLIFHKAPPGGIYNIGAKEEISTLNVTKKLLNFFGKDETFIEYVPDRLANDLRYSVDTNELLNDLGWKAKTNFEEGIKKTFDFYKNKYRKS